MCLWTPAPVGSRRGNRVTSLRWARLLRERGISLRHTSAAPGNRPGVLIALHAVEARESLLGWQGGPRVAVVTGTDLNGPNLDLALDTLEQVEAIVTLQSLDRQRLPPALRAKTLVIVPSVELPAGLTWKARPSRVAISVGHLRQVKEPLTLPQALSLCPDWSGLHLGGELESGWAKRLQSWPRFQWLGEKSRAQTLKIMARSHCFVISSSSEGCSNALCEALALGMPVLASDIAGNRGLLGEDFPGYFPVGDAPALARLLQADKLQSLAEWALPWRQKLKSAREAADLCSLLRELG